MRMKNKDDQLKQIIATAKFEGHDWYERYIIADALLKEAGFKEWSNEAGALIAIALLLAGYKTDQILHEKSIQQEISRPELIAMESAIKSNSVYDNKEIVKLLDELRANPALQQNIVKEFQKTEQKARGKKMNTPAPQPATDKVNIDDLVTMIIRHEGLVSKQTPFKITSPEMRTWDTIQGFKIDKTSPKPKGRENFIFLVNAEDVPKAIKKQLSNYVSNPSRYNLGATPTVKDALKVFDQSGANSKIAFINKELPYLNINDPLSSLFA